MAVTRRAGLNRSTLARWKQGTLPNDPLRFLRLAEVLDIDPLLLFSLETERFSQTCLWLGRLLLAHRVGAGLGSLKFLQAFWTAAGSEWPPPRVSGSRGKVSYRWNLRSFVNEGQFGPEGGNRNFYASVAIRSLRVAGGDGPQVWHFAYRDRVGWSALWHPYGSVALVGETLELYSYAGQKKAVPAPGPIAVETWFGEGDAEFRVASLHPFELDLTRAPPPGHATVRFEMPRVVWS